MLFSSLPYAALPVSNLKTGTEGNVMQLPVWSILHVLQAYKDWGKMIPHFLIFVCGPCSHTGNCKLVHQNLPMRLPFPHRLFPGFCLSCLEKKLTDECQRLKPLRKVVQVGFGLLQQQTELFCEVRAFAPNSPTLNRRLQHSDFLTAWERSLQTNIKLFTLT